MILLKDGGPLLSEFEQLANTYVYNDDAAKTGSLMNRVCDRLMPHKTIKKNKYLEILKQEDIGLVYVNTATNGELYGFLHELHCPIVTHVHELESALRIYTDIVNLDRVKLYTDHFIVNSVATKENLIGVHGIPEDRLTVCYPFVSVNDICSGSYERERVCAEIQVSHDSFIVCGSGTTIWCKSPDIFIQLAYAVLKEIPLEPLYFIWVGAFSDFSQHQLQYDIENLGLKGRVHFLGEKTDPLNYFAACNVFTQVSREDSFGLVCIEAAALAKPVACFDKAGGMREFVEDDAGFVAPYLDFTSMAQFIINLYFDKALCNKHGYAARDKVLARHSIDKAAPMILNVIDKMMGKQIDIVRWQ